MIFFLSCNVAEKDTKKGASGTSVPDAPMGADYANRLKSTSADGFLTAGLPSSVRY